MILKFKAMSPFCVGGLAIHNCRLGQRRPVVIYYVIAEASVDEHVASILIDKLPAVEDIAKDTELAQAKDILAGIDPNQTEEEFVASVLADLDFE